MAVPLAPVLFGAPPIVVVRAAPPVRAGLLIVVQVRHRVQLRGVGVVGVVVAARLRTAREHRLATLRLAELDLPGRLGRCGEARLQDEAALRRRRLARVRGEASGRALGPALPEVLACDDDVEELHADRVGQARKRPMPRGHEIGLHVARPRVAIARGDEAHVRRRVPDEQMAERSKDLRVGVGETSAEAVRTDHAQSAVEQHRDERPVARVVEAARHLGEVAWRRHRLAERVMRQPDRRDLRRTHDRLVTGEFGPRLADPRVDVVPPVTRDDQTANVVDAERRRGEAHAAQRADVLATRRRDAAWMVVDDRDTARAEQSRRGAASPGPASAVSFRA
jgi:hypothetical protein